MSGQKRQTITSGQSILSPLENITPAKAICEYVWNAIDASATQVTISVTFDGLNRITALSVRDNGDGITYSDLDKTFDKFLDTQKARVRTTITRGQKGKGRFSFWIFANRAEWISWQNGVAFTLNIDSNHMNEYLVGAQSSTERAGCGTEVTFSPVFINYDTLVNEVIPYIQNDVSWLLLAKPDVILKVNDKQITPIDHQCKKHNQLIGDTEFDVKTILWATKPIVEPSFIYFISTSGEVVHKESSELDTENFHSSAYIISSWFDSFDLDNELLGEDFHSHESEDFKYILSYVKYCMRNEFDAFKAHAAEVIINDCSTAGIFQEHRGDELLYHRIRHEQIVEIIKVIYEAWPEPFPKNLNAVQKKTFVQILDSIMETHKPSHFSELFEGIIDFSEAQIDKLTSIMGKASSTNITDTISS